LTDLCPSCRREPCERWHVVFYHKVEGGREIVTARFMVRDADWEKMPDTTDVRTMNQGEIFFIKRSVGET
jgi:hypothetical protein